MSENLKIILGGAVPLPTDVNQLVQGMIGTADLGSLALFPTVSDPGAASVAVNTAAGNLTGTYQYIVVLATGWKATDGTMYVRGFAPGTASASVAAVGEQVNITEIATGPADTTNQFGTIARILYRYGVVTPPTSALALSLVADSTSTLAATTYYVNYAFGNADGETTVGSSEASIAITTADSDDIRFSVTPPSGATFALIGMGTATGGEAQYAEVSTSGTVTYIGTNRAGVAATVSAGVLTVTIKAPPSDTSHAMPSSNTAYLAPTGSAYGFVAAISDNTTTTWTDNLADSSVGTGMPTSSSSPAWNGEAVTAAVPTVNSTGTSLGIGRTITQVGGYPTSGQFGVSTDVASAYAVAVTSSPAVIAQVTPLVGGAFRVSAYLRVTTATTVTLTVSYADAGGAQTDDILQALSLVAGRYLHEAEYECAPGTALAVSVGAGSAGDVLASVTIEGVS